MSVTLVVFQLPMFWLNFEALENTLLILVMAEVFQLFILAGLLRFLQPKNIPSIVVVALRSGKSVAEISRFSQPVNI